ncbi:hypothetical protein H4R18_003192 [Coemansia javaensis]|uniref:CobW/HypB/UreG nucleotide-binding domain-containing protein n=1 Tax=Coemansia javaensis TaxID=2761396 RepID=A0A9W8HG73_9FUNG|nr:hypothetical protein H4R18_003192 [Coemansia javaensis]
MSAVANPHTSRTVIDNATTPVTVLTGFLGAGKTTLVLSLLKRVDPAYKIVLLKNEFGDAETDSALARESHIQVTEMTNGCLCCVLVGQMKRALQEMKDKYCPDRIIVETSGSAFPAPIAWQIREMEEHGFHLDAILTVVDCINFCGYEDTSYTARLQAQYTDLVILNKWEHVSERQLDIVIDRVNDLNTDTPKIRADPCTGVDPEVVFGLDTRLFSLAERSDAATPGHHAQEVDLVEISRPWSGDAQELLSPASFVGMLGKLSREDVYRVKGIVRFSGPVPGDTDPAGPGGRLYIVNHAFGRYTFTPLTASTQAHASTLARLTVMGHGLRMFLPLLQDGLRALDSEIVVRPAHNPT